jgi:tetratricopeptide (TPR) repeat protein
MKKRLNVISLLFLLLFFSYCGKEDKQQIEPQGSSVHAALAEIDSLMWRQPDSAFALLLQFVGSPEADGLDTYNGHYCQLLISELLYKNDCEQTNRQDLQKAVAYFDSIMQVPEPVEGPSFKRNVFLTARAHYITGVGYYERDSVVEACAEYLKALETMEEHHEEQELVGKKAQFMTYIYNRLGDMFKEQLLAEPAIACYKQALFYCRREPTSKYGIPVLLYNLGIQYDIVDQTDSAALYYDEALANMPDFDNLHYRDLVSNKAIFAFYNLDYSSDSVIKILKQLVTLSADEEERTTRLLTLGHILFEDKQFDSSRVYLETLFEQEEEDITSQLMAAECLSSIYQMEGDSVKAHKYASFLAGFTMSEIEKKKEVSRINEMFKNHLAQKQEKQAEVNREKAIKKVIKIIIPIVVVIVVVIVVMAKLRSKKLLRQQQEEAERKLGEAEQQHRMEQAAISGRLKRSNQEVRELKDQIKQMDDLAAKTEMATSFNEEPICRLIMERVHEGQFKSKIDCELYKTYALDKQQMLDLRMAADRHFSQFTLRLRKAYPKLTSIDIDYCCLYLLNLTYADVSALMQRAYNTVVERDGKIQKIIGSEKPLPVLLMDIAQNPSSV